MMSKLTACALSAGRTESWQHLRGGYRDRPSPLQSTCLVLLMKWYKSLSTLASTFCLHLPALAIPAPISQFLTFLWSRTWVGAEHASLLQRRLLCSVTSLGFAGTQTPARATVAPPSRLSCRNHRSYWYPCASPRCQGMQLYPPLQTHPPLPLVLPARDGLRAHLGWASGIPDGIRRE